MAQDKQNNIIAEINELFLNKFPGSTSGNNEDIISHEESRFAKFDTSNPNSLKSPKLILGYPGEIPQGRLSKKFDDFLWNHFDIFEFIHIPSLKIGHNFTSIFQLLDLYDLLANERTSSLTARSTTSKVELNSESVSALYSELGKIIDERLKFYEIDLDDWWSNTISARRKLKEVISKEESDQSHLDGYYASNLLEYIDWNADTKLTDKYIFIYRILSVLDLAEPQNLVLLDEEPDNGILRREISEYIRTKIKSYENWKVKNCKSK